MCIEKPPSSETRAHETVNGEGSFLSEVIPDGSAQADGEGSSLSEVILTAALRSQLSRRTARSSVHTSASRLEGGASDISSSTRTPEAQACVRQLQQSSTHRAVPSSLPPLFILTATKTQPVTKEWKEAILDPNFVHASM